MRKYYSMSPAKETYIQERIESRKKKNKGKEIKGNW